MGRAINPQKTNASPGPTSKALGFWPGNEFWAGALARHGFWSLADQAVVSGGNFLTGVIIGRILTKEDFGLYILGFSVILFMTNSQTSLISHPLTFIFPNLEEDERKSFAGSSLLNQLCLSFIAMVILILGGVFLSYGWGPPGLEKVVWTLVIVISLIMFKEYVRQICFAQMQMVNAFVVDFFVSLLQIGGLVVLFFWGKLTVPLTFGAVGVAGVIPALGWLLTRAKSDVFSFRFARMIPDFRRCWMLGKWLFLTTIACQFGPGFYPWLLAFFHGTGDTGVLAACLGIILLANPFVLGMANYFHPLCSHAFAQGGVERLRRQVNRGILLFLVVLGTFSAAMFLWGDQLVTLVYGHKYSDTRLLLSLLALSQLASTLTFPINSGLLALKLPEVGFKSSLLAIVITATAGIGLVKTLGPVGVGIGLLSGNAAASTFRWIAFKRKIDSLRQSAEIKP